MKHLLKCLLFFFQDIFEVILICAAHFAVSYQQYMYVCDLGAAGHVVNSQETPSVPAGPGLWPWCSCLGVFVRMSFLIELYIHGVCVCWDSCLCMANCGGRALSDVLAVTSATGDTPTLPCPSACPTHCELWVMKGPLKLDQTKNTMCLQKYITFILQLFWCKFGPGFMSDFQIGKLNCAFFPPATCK